MCHDLVYLSSAGPLRACRNAFQVAFVPSKVGSPGSKAVFRDVSRRNCLLVGSRERNTSQMLGVGRWWRVPATSLSFPGTVGGII